MVSKASWRHLFYKAYAAIFYHYFNESKPITISRGNFFFHTPKVFWLQKFKKKEKENSFGIGFIAEQAGKPEKLDKMSLKKFRTFGTANRTTETLSYTDHYV